MSEHLTKERFDQYLHHILRVASLRSTNGDHGMSVALELIAVKGLGGLDVDSIHIADNSAIAFNSQDT